MVAVPVEEATPCRGGGGGGGLLFLVDMIIIYQQGSAFATIDADEGCSSIVRGLLLLVFVPFYVELRATRLHPARG